MNAALKTAALLGISPWLLAPAWSQTAQGPIPVMSDTPEYCATLRDRLDQMPSDVPPVVLTEVRSLESEGRRLCDIGQTRGGILRMRRALLMMMRASRPQQDDEP